jgi:acetoin utilization deacetylase AcuC-like enzyme
MKVFYSPRYVGTDYEFDTTRKAKWVADSLIESPIPGVTLEEPPPVSLDQLALVHDADYIRAIQMGEPRKLAESQGFTWDPEVWQMAAATNGGVVAAAASALEHGVAGSLSSGLHHARREIGEGFCTFNGLAIAARVALSAGARSVLILDLDAHFGGGTQSLIADEPRIWQIDVSVSDFDQYPPSERAWSCLVRGPADYLPTIERRLKELEQYAPRFDLCLYNAGVDPYEHCPMGGLAGIRREMLEERERMVFEWCRRNRFPIAFALAGGYIGRRLDERGLIDLHRLTILNSARA